jgi:hypothetical protein
MSVLFLVLRRMASAIRQFRRVLSLQHADEFKSDFRRRSGEVAAARLMLL